MNALSIIYGILGLSLLASLAEDLAPIQSLDRIRYDKVVPLTPDRIAAERALRPTFGLEVFVAFADQLIPPGEGFSRFTAEHSNSVRAALRAEVIPQLKKLSAASSAAFSAPDGFEIYGTYWLVNGVWGLADSDATIEALAALPGVAALYRLPRRGWTQSAEMDPAWLKPQPQPEAEFMRGDQELGVGLELIRAPAVWNELQITGKGVVSAVFDGGVHPNCPDLVQAMWRNSVELPNGKDDDGNGYVDDIFGINVRKRNGDVVPDAQAPRPLIKGPTSHGTICAGLIAGRGASGVLTGVAPRSKVMACVVGSPLCIDALQYCIEQDVHIVSMSFMSEQPHMFRALWRQQADHAAAAGLFLCGGAGNFANKPEYQGKPQIWIPKSIPSVMAGAGLTATGERASFSSFGPVSWAKVPGYGEAEIRKPDVATVAQGVTVVRFDKERPEPGANGNSFSGPQLAGCAALMLEANPELTPWQLQAIMNRTAVDIGEPGWDRAFGWGRLDCLEAVRAARAQ